jgi:pimeloyl-ACP methyl ester carboxylesterase
MIEGSGRLIQDTGIELAWRRIDGRAPTVVFLPGFNSDMTGSKATALAAYCAASGQAFLRFDYSGHGASGGRFIDGTIGRWTKDSLAVIDQLTEQDIILVGSSMGGWIGLLVALARPERVRGLLGIAAAPDFTETLMWDAMLPAEQAALMRDGLMMIPSQYGDPTPITRALIEDGRTHKLLHAPIALDCPVRLLHGQNDPDVPWQTALRLAEQLASADVQVMLIKDGDHRLSRPADLALLTRILAALLGEDGA